ncbi:redoxin domain-containing protein [Arenibaculum pallidiluteum]|uniref:redoxin domain-containing protein n=1 Tax=Arenibaculum pallidiluteum TaxID=2812559 RepID=UPI001A969E4D|nr:redoxin domain-containing protein [Arenibaculum pallidiluteum]
MSREDIARQPRVRAPDLRAPGLHWLNTPRNLSLDDLRGRLVILDFWTFCCINCLQMLPALARVEEAFPEDVAVIGVHSPKFPHERDPANVAAALRRHGIRHPVVHDPDFSLWKQYAVRAWPTLVFISPDGYVTTQHAGEVPPEVLVEAVGDALSAFRAARLLAPGPAPLEIALPAAAAALPGRFAFPGKIKPLPAGGWALADAGHNQVVLLDTAGAELARFGSGLPGRADGPAGEARFDAPQGIAADEGAVFVADTGNHAIRRIDLASGTVSTLAGSGGRGGPLGGPAPGPDTALASPWDIEVRGSLLLFANAGTHQIGQLALETGRVARLAGAGPEGLRDGAAAEAHLAQPSGLALSADGGTLHFADAETSSARQVDLATGRVRTLVGSGLFDFGHVNGPLAEAQMQHCLGIATRGGALLVADTYNGAVRVVDPAGGLVSDLDDGFLCEDPVCLPLDEPAGVWADGPDRILVSDTNNHRIVVLDAAMRRSRIWAE